MHLTHLKDSGMSYGGHLFYASSFAIKAFWASIVILFHGFCPFWGHWYGRKLLIEMYYALPTGEDKFPPPPKF